eukprot:scaffold60529_cov61-Phaeocystis_antarctica.AAC.1
MPSARIMPSGLPSEPTTEPSGLTLAPVTSVSPGPGARIAPPGPILPSTLPSGPTTMPSGRILPSGLPSAPLTVPSGSTVAFGRLGAGSLDRAVRRQLSHDSAVGADDGAVRTDRADGLAVGAHHRAVRPHRAGRVQRVTRARRLDRTIGVHLAKHRTVGRHHHAVRPDLAERLAIRAHHRAVGLDARATHQRGAGRRLNDQALGVGRGVGVPGANRLAAGTRDIAAGVHLADDLAVIDDRAVWPHHCVGEQHVARPRRDEAAIGAPLAKHLAVACHDHAVRPHLAERPAGVHHHAVGFDGRVTGDGRSSEVGRARAAIRPGANDRAVVEPLADDLAVRPHHHAVVTQLAKRLAVSAHHRAVGLDLGVGVQRVVGASAHDRAARPHPAKHLAVHADDHAVRPQLAERLAVAPHDRAVGLGGCARVERVRWAGTADRAIRVPLAQHLAVLVHHHAVVAQHANGLAVGAHHRAVGPHRRVRGQHITLAIVAGADDRAVWAHLADDLAVLAHHHAVVAHLAQRPPVRAQHRAVGCHRAARVQDVSGPGHLDRAVRTHLAHNLAVGTDDHAVVAHLAQGPAICGHHRAVRPDGCVRVQLVAGAGGDNGAVRGELAQHLAIRAHHHAVLTHLAEGLAVRPLDRAIGSDGHVGGQRVARAARDGLRAAEVGAIRLGTDSVGVARSDDRAVSVPPAGDLAIEADDGAIGLQLAHRLAVLPNHGAVGPHGTLAKDGAIRGHNHAVGPHLAERPAVGTHDRAVGPDCGVLLQRVARGRGCDRSIWLPPTHDLAVHANHHAVRPHPAERLAVAPHDRAVGPHLGVLGQLVARAWGFDRAISVPLAKHRAIRGHHHAVGPHLAQRPAVSAHHRAVGLDCGVVSHCARLAPARRRGARAATTAPRATTATDAAARGNVAQLVLGIALSLHGGGESPLERLDLVAAASLLLLGVTLAGAQQLELLHGAIDKGCLEEA